MAETLLDRLNAELAAADAELTAHMASWEYAFAMGSGREGARRHPKHVATQACTEQLMGRCRHLRAQLSEHQL
jgi:hypothetical protein